MEVHCNLSANYKTLKPILTRENFQQRESMHHNPMNDCNNLLRKNTNAIPCSSSVNMLKKITKGYMEFVKDVDNSKKSITHRGKEMVGSENSTSTNILKRIDDIDEKLQKVYEDNERLRTSLSARQTEKHKDVKHRFKSTVKPFEKKENRKAVIKSEFLLEHKVNKNVIKNESGTAEVPSTFSTSLCCAKSYKKKDILNADKLEEKYYKLHSNLKTLQLGLIDKFESKVKYQELKEQLFCEEKKKEDIEKYNEELKERYNNRKHQIQILRDELGEDYPNVELTQGKSSNLSTDPLLSLLKQNTLDSDEPADCKLVTICIKYVNEFNKQFQQQNFKMAAELAVNSPNGILRNYSTFLQFKNAGAHISTNTASVSPTFMFCNALMNTSYPGGLLCDNLCQEIVLCAISENDADLTEHWLQSCAITFSKDIGHLLLAVCKCSNKCGCRWTYLALQVYSKIKYYKGILHCHLKFYNFKHVNKYMRKCKFSDGEFKELISNYPDVQLSYLLTTPRDENHYVTLPGVISTFLAGKNSENIVNLLRDVYDDGLHGETLVDCLLKETVYDDMGEERWEQVVDICKRSGDFDVAEDLYMSLLIRHCLNNATTFCLMDYIS